MRFEGLDLNLLIALDAILEERSVMGASRRLHLSQPAMSAAVGRLRQYFNDEIFTISRRKLVPTPLAQSLEKPTRDILLRIRANLISPPKFDPASSERRFRLVVSDYASIVLMHAVMKHVYRDAPGVCREILPFSDRVGDQLQRGEVDFVVVPASNLIAGHPSQHLSADEFCCVAWRGNRQIGRSISLRRYLQAGHITAQLGLMGGAAFDERALVQLGYRPYRGHRPKLCRDGCHGDRDGPYRNDASSTRCDLCAKLSVEAAARADPNPPAFREPFNGLHRFIWIPHWRGCAR